MSLKSFLTVSVAASALLLPAAAQADNAYVSVFGGFSAPDVDASAGPFSFFSSRQSSFQTSFTHVGNVFFRASKWVQLSYDLGMIDATFRRITYTTTSWGTGPFGVSDELDDGFVVGAALGVDFQDGWRAEVEVAYREYDFGGAQVVSALQALTFTRPKLWSLSGTIAYYTSFPYGFVSSKVIASTSKLVLQTATRSSYSRLATATATTDGDISAFSLMANVWYDFDFGEGVPITPFVGIGAGLAMVDASYRGSVALPYNQPYYIWSHLYLTNTFSFSYDADDYVFAWQAAAGVAYEFEGGATLSAQYRYFATGDADLGRRDISVQSHEALIGLSFPLGQ